MSANAFLDKWQNQEFLEVNQAPAGSRGGRGVEGVRRRTVVAGGFRRGAGRGLGRRVERVGVYLNQKNLVILIRRKRDLEIVLRNLENTLFDCL